MTLCHRLILSALALIPALPATAEIPRVVTDLPVVDSLVRQVMGDLGAPELLLQAGSDPHHYQLRPDQARNLARADLLVWIGPEMTPWLDRASTALAARAVSLPLLSLPQTYRRDFSGGSGHDHAAPAGHDHGDLDPHAWLDPGNGGAWLGAIADGLSQSDPENAPVYRRNAERARAALAETDAAIRAELAPLAGKSFVTLHDAYGYFTDHYGLSPAIAISPGDASAVSAARLSGIRDRIRAEAVTCAFPEANHSDAPILTAIEDSAARQGPALDPEGSTLPAGPDLYAGVLRGLARALTSCLGQN
ncbi:zinc ABC transporter substrate-binding protein [Paracoccus halophilus]|nr:zinc ABC transporter substrate-binding protein [Paracoccus halophilus]KGJ04783.1 zinc ABC transporter substrate-binding protein [Paracoccus halophilus]